MILVEADLDRGALAAAATVVKNVRLVLFIALRASEFERLDLAVVTAQSTLRRSPVGPGIRKRPVLSPGYLRRNPSRAPQSRNPLGVVALG